MSDCESFELRKHATRPRFIAPMPRLRDAAGWRDQVVSLERSGFDAVAVSEHYSHGWTMDSLVALSFAAAATSRINVLTLVLNNDLHHPAVLAKAIATADVLSDGRATLGVGAGWLRDDYRALGVEFAPAGIRIDHLAEALDVIELFFTSESVTYHGRYYHLEDFEALPRPVQRPRPSLLVGAGGPRMLALAGRRADTVGLHVNLGSGHFQQSVTRELTREAVEEKVEVIRTAAHEAGRPTPALQLSPAIVDIDGVASVTHRPGFTDYVRTHPQEFAHTPMVLTGEVGAVAEDILRWTQDLGIEQWHLGSSVEAAARVVAEVRRLIDRRDSLT